jgi:hypothetical protein
MTDFGCDWPGLGAAEVGKSLELIVSTFSEEMHMLRNVWLLVFVSSTALVLPVRAEKVNMTPQQLRQTATHVVTGQVMAIYERTETTADWKYARYVAEVRVSECEKGEGIKPGDIIYVRYWRRSWVGNGRVPPSTSGHRRLPIAKESHRIYLARNAYDGFVQNNNDGGYNVIGANGFEKLAPATDR